MIGGDALTRLELRGLLAIASGRRHRAGARYRHARRDALFLELVAIAGLWPHEALALQVRDLPPSADDSTLAVRHRGRDRRVAIPWSLGARLWRYVDGAALLLEQRLFPFSSRAARRKFRLYAERAGLLPVHTLDSLRLHCAAIATRRRVHVLHVAQRQHFDAAHDSRDDVEARSA